LRSGILEVLMRLSDSANAERARADERQRLLIAELNHRVRNILALIRGLISQSRGTTQSVESFVDTLDERIRALARAHDQVTHDHWGPARLRDLLEIETRAYLGAKRGRVKMEGPNVLVQPIAFTSLALVFHELTTNSVKYGALSDNGNVAIAWHLDDAGDLVIDWREQDGPAVVPPTRRGFGSTVIEQSVPYDLGGKAQVNYPVTGLTAHLSIPAKHVAGVAPQTEQDSAETLPPVNNTALEGRSVLLVEDSMIIALAAEDMLHEAGARAVATVADVAGALAIIAKGGIEIALLDVNLGDETSTPVADALTARGIPFVFATGYGEAPQGKYAQTPVLNKPYNADQLRQAFGALPQQTKP
jgi:two-component sensor histidine kinase/CheY-like chemotaxis protein